MARRRSASEDPFAVPCEAVTAPAVSRSARAAPARTNIVRLITVRRCEGLRATTPLFARRCVSRQVESNAEAPAIPTTWDLSRRIRPRYRRAVATARERRRCRERLQRLGESSLDSQSIVRETVAELQRVIGFSRWCVPL